MTHISFLKILVAKFDELLSIQLPGCMQLISAINKMMQSSCGSEWDHFPHPPNCTSHNRGRDVLRPARALRSHSKVTLPGLATSGGLRVDSRGETEVQHAGRVSMSKFI